MHKRGAFTVEIITEEIVFSYAERLECATKEILERDRELGFDVDLFTIREVAEVFEVSGLDLFAMVWIERHKGKEVIE